MATPAPPLPDPKPVHGQVPVPRLLDPVQNPASAPPRAQLVHIRAIGTFENDMMPDGRIVGTTYEGNYPARQTFRGPVARSVTCGLPGLTATLGSWPQSPVAAKPLAGLTPDLMQNDDHEEVFIRDGLRLHLRSRVSYSTLCGAQGKQGQQEQDETSPTRPGSRESRL